MVLLLLYFEDVILFIWASTMRYFLLADMCLCVYAYTYIKIYTYFKVFTHKYVAYNTADSDCSHEIKRCLLLGRKVMTNLDSILKSRGITLPTKFHLVKDVVSPVVMYGCKSFHHVKADYWRIDAFEPWCWRRLWESLYCKDIKPENGKGNLSWIFFGMTDAEAEAPILWPLDMKSWLIRKYPNAGKAGGEGEDRGWDGWVASLTQWTWVWASSGSWWWPGKPGVLQSLGSQSRTRLSVGIELC